MKGLMDCRPGVVRNYQMFKGSVLRGSAWRNEKIVGEIGDPQPLCSPCPWTSLTEEF